MYCALKENVCILMADLNIFPSVWMTRPVWIVDCTVKRARETRTRRTLTDHRSIYQVMGIKHLNKILELNYPPIKQTRSII